MTLVLSLAQVDLTAYVEMHEFAFDAVLDEDVSNDEVTPGTSKNWNV